MSHARTVFPATLMAHPSVSLAFCDKNEQLGFLPGDDHLVLVRPGGQRVGRCLCALCCHLHRVAGAEDCGVIGVDVRGLAGGTEGLG